MIGADKSLCFRVDVNITKPLRRDVKVVLEGKNVWIKFKYVKLQDYCYMCGSLSHI